MRHGRTAWNADRRFQGHTDIPLDDEGRAQAAALATLLRDDRIDVAVSSDLSRAAETARIVLGARDVALRLDADWREMRFGSWEGLNWDEITARTPELDPAQAATVRAFAPPGGEDYDQLCVRIARATSRIQAELAGGGTALIATHAGPLHALLRNLLGESAAEALNVRFLTGSVTRFRRTEGGWELDALNETAAGQDLQAADSPARKPSA